MRIRSEQGVWWRFVEPAARWVSDAAWALAECATDKAEVWIPAEGKPRTFREHLHYRRNHQW